MMKYRTDLAIERMEMAVSKADDSGDKAGGKREGSPAGGAADGISVEKEECGDGVSVTRIEITSLAGEARLEKPMGNYITIEAEGITEGAEETKEKAGQVIAGELSRLIKFHSRLKVLVAGLGNVMVTPDSLGPAAVSKIRVTNHLFEMFGADEDDEMSRVSCIAPGVTATTGMETAEIVSEIARLVRPEVVIVIDSLAARDIQRLNTTVQITDTGISPGAGTGNHRTGIDEKTVGARVVAIGVPTVIDITTVIGDALADNVENVEKMERYMERYDRQTIVTSTDIDMLIKDFSDTIANGINKTLHPGIYS